MCSIYIFYECKMIYWNFNSRFATWSMKSQATETISTLVALLIFLDERREESVFYAPVKRKQWKEEASCLFISFINQLKYQKTNKNCFFFYPIMGGWVCVCVCVWTYRINCFRRCRVFAWLRVRFCLLPVCWWWR